ncbi:putative non-specific serine/threonine protein kinase [Helianthus anomalus]
MADSGNTPSTGGGVSLTSKTSILGQKLYVIIIVTVIIVTVVLLLLLFYFRRNSNAKRRRRMHVKHSSGLLPFVSEPINEESIEKTSKLNEFEKDDDEKDEIKPIVKVVESKLGFTNSGSNESGTSRSDGAASSVSAENLSNLGWGRWYGLTELEIATSNFATENVIGEGGYGIVYRGVVHDGAVVAVKNLLNNKFKIDRCFQNWIGPDNEPDVLVVYWSDKI